MEQFSKCLAAFVESISANVKIPTLPAPHSTHCQCHQHLQHTISFQFWRSFLLYLIYRACSWYLLCIPIHSQNIRLHFSLLGHIEMCMSGDVCTCADMSVLTPTCLIVKIPFRATHCAKAALQTCYCLCAWWGIK